MYDSVWLLFVGIVLFFIWAIYTLQEAFWPNRYYPGSQEYLIVFVENMENIIEGIMADILVLHRQMGDDAKLIIVDVNSQDKTVEILKKINYPYNYFAIIQLQDRQEVKPLLEEYKKYNCLIIQYLANKIGVFQGISTCKSALYNENLGGPI